MGTFSSWGIEAWTESGGSIGVSGKESIQDWMIDEGFSDLCCDHSPGTPYVMEFCDTSYHAYDMVQEAIANYAHIHTDVIIEVYYSFQDEDTFGIMRFHGKDFEEVERISYYPPFQRIKIPWKDKESEGVLNDSD